MTVEELLNQEALKSKNGIIIIFDHIKLCSRLLYYYCYSGDAKGYILGEPLPYEPSSVRGLSPVAAVVMRVLMHSVLLWTTCNKDDVRTVNNYDCINHALF